jgi:hypothetical protein
MADATLKYLEFAQTAIARMAGHSFALKGWSITLTTAVIAVAYKQNDKDILLVGLMPVVLFWGLDAYFLTLEHGFRDIYKRVASEFASDTPPSFDLSPAKITLRDVVGNMIRPVQLFIHGPLFVVLVACWTR